MDRRIGGFSTMTLLAMVCSNLLLPCDVGYAAQSGDGYIKEDGKSWTLGTDRVERTIALEDGKLLMKSFKSKVSGHEMVPPGSQCNEFFIATGDGNDRITSASGGWKLISSKTKTLQQGELQLDITMQRESLQATKSYVVYPTSSIIREWVTFKNVGADSIKIADPGFLTFSARVDDPSSLDFNWMTGGENSPGSWNLHTEKLPPDKPRTFDSYESLKAAIAPGAAKTDEYGFRPGSSTYAPWYSLFSPIAKEGLIIGWDYFGHWTSSFSLDKAGAVTVELKVAGHKQTLQPGESVTTPKAFVGVYQGDLDNAGNECLDWQYRYLWDYTRDGWFPAIRMLGHWYKGVTWGHTWSGSGADFGSMYRKAFRVVDMMRYCGADVYHRDWGWWDMAGDWNGPDWRSVNNYLQKQDMGLLLYGFLYTADVDSRVWKEHHDWLMPDQRLLNLARPEVVEFIKGKLDEWYDKWGPFEWRNDSGFTQQAPGPHTTYEDDTPLLGQDQGFRKVIQDFLDKHPDCAFQPVNGGGAYGGYEYTRFGSSFSFSDGQVGVLTNYYASLMFPPDKTSDIPDKYSPDNYDKATWRGLLSLNFDMTGDSIDPAKLDGVRELIDIYHYLQSKGVVGRWVKVYRPVITGDDPTMYLQRLSGDRRRGLIIPKHAAPRAVTIKPKGLLPDETYIVSFQESENTESLTGTDLMNRGITIAKMLPGELVYLNLPLHPGSKLDTEAPSVPQIATKKWALNMGYPGVEVEWKPAQDNNWVSYYEISRHGVYLDKLAKGTLYFDHSAGADLAANYEVRAVDGAGNSSARVAAGGMEAKPAQICDDASSGITFTGDWQRQTGIVPAHAGTLTRSNQKGGTAEVTFEGQKVLWFTKLGPDGGKAAVSIDGGAAEVVDTYSADDIWGICAYRKDLPPGKHTLRVTVLGEHGSHPADYLPDPASPQAQWVYVDGVRVEQ